MTSKHHPADKKAEILSKEEYEKNYNEILDKAFKKTEKSVIGFFIKNFRFTYLILLTLVAVGIYSLLTIPKEAEPEIEVPFAVVNTVYAGANPSDVEELITNKIEKEINNLDNLKIYNSSSAAGFSSIFVEFEAEADLEESFRELREVVDNAEPELPEEVDSPIVTEINFNDIPIVTYSLVGEYSDVELKDLADKIQEELENIPDVSQVDILGGLEQEYQVIVNEQKLKTFGTNINQISSAIRSANFSLPAGDIDLDGFRYDIRVKGRFTDAKDLESIVVATLDNSPVLLNEIALIKDTFKEKNSLSKIGFQDQDSRNTISLQIRKKTGGNILAIVDNANAKLDEIRESGIIPADLTIQKTNDNSTFIKNDIKTLGTSAIQTVILITLILVMVLSLQGAIITALAVPFAFLSAFIFLNLQGLTLNSMVLFSLVLSLGLMVDNAIIIIEGVNEYISEHKKSPYQAAMLSVWNYKWAITAGTLTTVSAFAPMLLVSGILGQYMANLPRTISVTLLSSLFVALVIIPTLVTRFVKVENNGDSGHRDKKRHQFIDGFMKKLYQKYGNYMQNVLPYKKKRRARIALVWLLFFVALSVPVSGLMKIEMFPRIDLEYFYVNMEAPVGTSLEKSEEIIKQAEQIVREVPEMDNYVINVGGSAASGFGGDTGSAGTHLGNITVNLVDMDEREKTSYDIADSLRDKLAEIQEASVTILELQAGPPTGAPIEVRISGDDTGKIAIITNDVLNFFKNKDGVINPEDNLENSAGEFTFDINKQKANYYGLDVLTVASAMRSAIYGTGAGTVNVDGDDVDITVKYPEEDFRTVNDLGEILLTTRTGDTIPVKEIASVELEPALLSINHRNGDETAIVTADVEEGVNLATVLVEFEEFQRTMELPKGYTISVGGEVEDIQRSFTELFLSMILSVVLISIILVLQFNSFKQPFLILFTVPLAFIGVVFGLNLLLMPFSFMAFIGIVSLSGIVVNDSIVLIDRINKNLENGMEYISAIIEGGTARMQPILLTSLTTIAGIFPLIYADEFWRGFSITVIFGLLFSTILMLFIIPMYFAGMCRKDKCIDVKK